MTRNRYRECLESGLSFGDWLASGTGKGKSSKPFLGSEYPLPPPLNRKVFGVIEKRGIYDPNMQYMRKACAELVAIDVGRMGSGGHNMEGFPDAVGSVDGIPFYCEFKRPGGRVSSAQLGHLRRWMDQGHASIIVATPDGFYRWHCRERPIGFVDRVPVY